LKQNITTCIVVLLKMVPSIWDSDRKGSVADT